jgi:hypothetical protein
MPLFGKGIIWKMNQQRYFFRKWWKRHWQWSITTMLVIIGIIVTYVTRRA